MVIFLKKCAKKILDSGPSVEGKHFQSFRFLWARFLVCRTPEAVEAVLLRHQKNFERGSIVRGMIRPILGRSIFTLDGADWLGRRRLFNEWYNAKNINDIVQTYGRLFDDHAPLLVDGQRVNIHRWHKRVALSAFCRDMLGLPVERDTGRIDHILSLMDAYRYRLAAKYILRQGDITPGSFTDLVLQKKAASSLTHRQAVADMATCFSFMHTTSNSLSILSRHMIDYPDVYAGADTAEKRLSFCLESTRLQPTVYVLFRQAACPIDILGQPITKGTHMIIPVKDLQQRAASWPDPQAFCPHRFEEAGQMPASKNAYYVFGAGPQQCPGRQLVMKMMVCALEKFRAYGVVLRPGPVWPPAFDRSLVLRPDKNALWVQVTRQD